MVAGVGVGSGVAVGAGVRVGTGVCGRRRCISGAGVSVGTGVAADGTSLTTAGSSVAVGAPSDTGVTVDSLVQTGIDVAARGVLVGNGDRDAIAVLVDVGARSWCG